MGVACIILIVYYSDMEKLNPIISKRVPRFVEEYAKDRNGTRAAMRAGYTQNENAASVVAARLLGDVRIKGLIKEQLEKVSKAATYEAADLLRDWIDVATADPTGIVTVRRLNCRHCYGFDHAYQWTAREYAAAVDLAIAKGEPCPGCDGGFDFAKLRDPCPTCPECEGEGVPEVFVNDLSTLTASQRKLIASVKQTKDGVEVKLKDQEAVRERIAKHLGLLIERKEVTGKDGKPLGVVTIPVEVPSDPAALGALYATILGG